MIKNYLLYCIFLTTSVVAAKAPHTQLYTQEAVVTVDDAAGRLHTASRVSESADNPGLFFGMFAACGDSSKNMAPAVADIFLAKVVADLHLTCGFWQTQDAIKSDTDYKNSGVQALVAFLSSKKQLQIAYVGDLRVMVIRDGTLLFVNPVYTQTVKTKPSDMHDRSVTYSCVGNTDFKATAKSLSNGWAKKAYPDMNTLQLESGDIILMLSVNFAPICSEKVLQDAGLLKIFNNKKSFKEKIEQFVADAQAHGCKGSLKLMGYSV